MISSADDRAGTASHGVNKPGSWLSDLGLRLSEWFEHWFPDAFCAGAASRSSSSSAATLARRAARRCRSAQWFGAGFWDLVAFTMQMALIILTGYAVATVSAGLRDHSPPGRASRRTGRSAAAFVGLFSMLSSLAVVELQPDFQRAPGQAR